MAKVTQNQWKLDVDRDINTNGQQRITGLLMNSRLTDLGDSILWGAARSARNVAVQTAGTIINFTSPIGTTNYFLLIRCYNATGEAIGYTVEPARQTVSGFHITPAQDGFIDYLVIG